MKKILVFKILIIAALQIGCSSNPDPEIVVIDPVEDINLPPSTFDYRIEKNESGTEVVISWSKSIDPENELVTYSVYLDNVLLGEGLEVKEFEFTDLLEQTSYSVKIIAKDPQGNETIKVSSFTTVKYYLRYSKFYNFDDVFVPGGRPYSIIKTSSGEYVIAGHSNRPDSNGKQFFVLKIDEQGNEKWKNFYLYQIGDASFFKITELRDQNFVLAAGNDIIKIDSDGNLIWHKEIEGYGDGGSSTIKSVKEDSKGNLLVVGIRSFYSNPNINHGGSVTKLDELGNILWDKEYTPVRYSYFQDLVVTESDDLIILGSLSRGDSNSNYDFWVVATNNDGEKLWERTYGTTRDDFPYQIIKTNDGNYAFCGGSNFGLNQNASLYKIDLNGNEIWNNMYSHNNFNNFSLTETNDGGFAATGYNSGSFRLSLTFLKYDNSGNVQWEKLFYKFAHDSLGHGILQTDDGGFIAAGVDDDFGTGGFGTRIWVVKTDPEGYFGEF